MEHPHSDDLVTARGVVHGFLLGIASWLTAFLLWLVLFSLLSTADAQTLTPIGQGIVVTPTKIMLLPEQTASRFIIVNKGENVATYDIDFVPLMEHENSARDIASKIIYAPKRITLQGGERQTVRFLIRADYSGSVERARIRFQAAAPEGNVAPTSRPSKPTAQVNLLYGVTVPIQRGE